MDELSEYVFRFVVSTTTPPARLQANCSWPEIRNVLL